MVRKINESVNKEYYMVSCGGIYNYHKEKFYTMDEVRNFLESNIIEGPLQIIKCENITSNFKKYTNTEYRDSNGNKRNVNELGHREIFDTGITSVDNYID